MIEKLDKHLASNINSCNMERNIMVANTAIEKINELVDAVNELTSCVGQLGVEFTNEETKEPADPYKEQRKWIGKLCKFWNEDRPDDLVYSILYRIYPDDKIPYESIYTFHYTHCKPVKPDDDIIYKGA